MTLIKWPGGKSREIKEFQHLIPTYDRYIEPFFGGGAVFFHENPKQSVINDISTNLTDFYSLVKTQNEHFKFYLLQYNDAFSYYKNHTSKNIDIFFEKYSTNASFSKQEIMKLFINKEFHEIITNYEIFYDFLAQSINDKFKRTKKNELKKQMCQTDLENNLITGITSGFYLYFRKVYNDIQLAPLKHTYSKEYTIANFFWIREYCYGSMFRYNSEGAFNIPYGGISYNNKDFSRKINQIFNEKTKVLFENTNIFNDDFETLLDQLTLSSSDFIFLDPPYDTEFSDYEGRSFKGSDQERLRDFLLTTPAKFLLVIKNTNFIYSLYNRDEFTIENFDKTYTYNIRDRNNRAVSHLIITNKKA
ncbi:DNA adenine methylase [Vagococcus coleopterorum]|uniref:site-specific DNA-methyltransferase (adenine-specific) n=1 Tax=Vagococcus coleopterorum TaxID=2714946 RepID=A0A6G8AKP9_9ENTE|nr:DNA adenine methylase [Vagococcus coleopterorum]QIL45664.1 DNA adenine methylase [Vagococcus coleopterorum]